MLYTQIDSSPNLTCISSEQEMSLVRFERFDASCHVPPTKRDGPTTLTRERDESFGDERGVKGGKGSQYISNRLRAKLVGKSFSELPSKKSNLKKELRANEKAVSREKALISFDLLKSHGP